jgi:hypothetical protein
LNRTDKDRLSKREFFTNQRDVKYSETIQKMAMKKKQGEISGSHGAVYEDNCLLGY